MRTKEQDREKIEGYSRKKQLALQQKGVESQEHPSQCAMMGTGHKYALDGGSVVNC